ncbi:Metallo-dependent hydrolase [Suhomyces tanzawaensis NRRL Y-17324]|uniref:Probable guanine deaminase n=1 Tax=Suhomyces tanzawaensis NRRL Y-17324 TaxID=984487 RepID=A0A1E4SSD5_9ASCO|nr:Metallo-dependent hydrolase [Suhomyces tanzawaensis NRRL Y-17324]ODV82302.1 Metallo-dependent hydrolase [Suhomyces tanzawaensis NRRL Y-17324]
MTPIAITSIPYTLYHGTFVHTPSLDQLELKFNALVGVNSEGEIDFVHDEYTLALAPVEFFKQSYPDHHNYTTIEFVDYTKDPTKFIVPGFVDTHIHASQYPNVGVGLGTPLLDWLHSYTFPLENKFSDLDFATKIYTKIIQKTIASGTTCASYFTTIDPNSTNAFADLLLQYGQRGFVGKVCMDHNDTYHAYEEDFASAKESMDKVIAHIEKVNPEGQSLVTPIITPRFAPVCSRELLKYLGELSASRSLPIQTHISENKKEIELVRDLFPECKDYTDVYDQHKLLNQSTILAHAVHLTEDERTVIKNKNCSISHCPTSNTFISSGEAPIKQYLYKDQINVSLGTDVSGGFDLSILGIVKQSILVSHHVAMTEKDSYHQLLLKDAIFMATKGGAIAVGLDNTIGSVEKGRKFDMQLIDLRSYNSNADIFEWQLPSQEDLKEERELKMMNLLGKWIFTGDDRNCVKVWCNGRVILDKSARDERWVMVEPSTSA